MAKMPKLQVGAQVWPNIPLRDFVLIDNSTVAGFHQVLGMFGFWGYDISTSRVFDPGDTIRLRGQEIAHPNIRAVLGHLVQGYSQQAILEIIP